MLRQISHLPFLSSMTKAKPLSVTNLPLLSSSHTTPHTCCSSHGKPWTHHAFAQAVASAWNALTSQLSSPNSYPFHKSQLKSPLLQGFSDPQHHPVHYSHLRATCELSTGFYSFIIIYLVYIYL